MQEKVSYVTVLEYLATLFMVIVGTRAIYQPNFASFALHAVIYMTSKQISAAYQRTLYGTCLKLSSAHEIINRVPPLRDRYLMKRVLCKIFCTALTLF